MEIKIKREQYIQYLHKTQRESQFRQKRVIDNIGQYQFWLDSYENNIQGAINFMKSQIQIDQDCVQLYLFLLYECFIYLDEQFSGDILLEQIEISLNIYQISIQQIVEYQIINRFYHYESYIIINILNLILKSKIINPNNIGMVQLLNYMECYLNNNQKVQNILLNLSNNIICQREIINRNNFMNYLFDQLSYQKLKILNRLGKGNLYLLQYFYKNSLKLKLLLSFDVKYALKIFLRLLCYDETQKMTQLMREQQIPILIETNRYAQYENQVELFLSYF